MKLKTPEPFWLVKNGIINSYPSLREDIKTDILIIGAGITGSLIAHQCIKDGYDAVVLDRREVCNGSTSATTSMLQYEIDVPLYELTEMIGEEGAVKSYLACFKSIDDLQKITKEIKSSAGFEKKKSLFFVAHKKEREWVQQEFTARENADLPVKWLSSEEIVEKFGIKETFGGILSDQGASVDAFKLAHELLAYNHAKGLRIFDKTEITETKYGNRQVKVTTEYGNTVTAKKIIYCNGFESVEVIPENFVKLLSTFAIVGESTEQDYGALDDLVVWNSADPYLYMRTTDDNRILVGGGDMDFVDEKKRNRALHRKSVSLERSIEKHLPEADFRTDFSWAGVFGETKDGLPYIGEHPDFPGAYFVLGFGGNGITFSVIGMEMVSVHLKKQKHELDEYFRFGR